MKHYIDENKTYKQNVRMAYGGLFDEDEIESIALEVEDLICDFGVHPDDAIDRAIENLGLNNRLNNSKK